VNPAAKTGEPLSGFFSNQRPSNLKCLERRGGIGTFAHALGEIDPAAEYSVVFHSQPQRLDVSLHHAAGAQLHAAAGHHVAVNVTQDQHVFGGEVGGHIGIGADGQTAFRKVHRSFHAPIHNQILAALHFTANDYALANARWSILHCHGRIPSGRRK
jgi:hypothetical protein